MEDIEYQLMAELQNDHWWFRGRRRIIEKIILSLKLPPNLNILEVGCGMGGNLKMLAKYGKVYALDSHEEAAKYAKSLNIEAEVAQVIIPDKNLAFITERKFDLIVLFDVLEHLGNADECLKVLHDALKPSGRIIVTVPAFQFLWSQHDISQHHKLRYGKKQLEQILDKSGFKVNYITFFNFWLFPLIATIRIGKKLAEPYFRNRSIKSELKKTYAPLNAVLSAVFSSESWWIPACSLPFGVSLLAVCWKKQPDNP